MKKRTFLLLEILIAFLLVALCIVPIIKQPLQLFKKEMEKLEEMEKERLADWSFSEVKELFLKNEIPWGKIPKEGEKAGPFFLPDVKIQLPGCKPKAIRRKFMIQGKGKKEGSQGEDFRQLYIRISFNEEKQTYEFRLPVQKQFVAK